MSAIVLSAPREGASWRWLAPFENAFEAWRALTWRHWAWTLGISAAAGSLQFLLHQPRSWVWTWGVEFGVIASFMVFGSVYLLAVAIVERTEWRHGHLALRRYLVALAVASALCGAIGYVQSNTAFGARFNPFASIPPMRGQIPKKDGFVISGWKPWTPYLHQGGHWASLGTLPFAMLATLVHLRRRNARRAWAALADAERERAAAARALVLSRLKSAQAQVDPDFLFESLGRVESLYSRDPAAADALVDALVAFLRAALPRLREHHSTLAAEMGTAGAFVNVLRASFGGLPAFESAIDPGIGDIEFPPLVLLPMVRRLAGEAGSPVERLRISAARSNAVTRVELESVGRVPTISAEDQAAWLARLAGLFGTRATLAVVARGDAGTRLVLEVRKDG